MSYVWSAALVLTTYGVAQFWGWGVALVLLAIASSAALLKCQADERNDDNWR